MSFEEQPKNSETEKYEAVPVDPEELARQRGLTYREGSFIKPEEVFPEGYDPKIETQRTLAEGQVEKEYKDVSYLYNWLDEMHGTLSDFSEAPIPDHLSDEAKQKLSAFKTEDLKNFQEHLNQVFDVITDELKKAMKKDDDVSRRRREAHS